MIIFHAFKKLYRHYLYKIEIYKYPSKTRVVMRKFFVVQRKILKFRVSLIIRMPRNMEYYVTFAKHITPIPNEEPMQYISQIP